MDFQSILQLIKEVGPAVGIAAVLVIIFRDELKHSRTQMQQSTNQLLEQAKEREAMLLKLIADQTAALKEHTDQARTFHDSVNEAHTCQMKEHQATEEKLNAIKEVQDKTCEVLHNLVSASQSLTKSTDELQEAVARINGRTH